MEEITKTLAVIINGQKAYGKDYSINDTFRYYKLKLDGRYSADKVISAILAYTDVKNDIPAPADIINIINPPPTKITYADYKYALEQHKAEGYPMFGYFWQVIADYKKQQQMETKTPSYYEILERRESAKLTGGLKQIGGRDD